MKSILYTLLSLVLLSCQPASDHANEHPVDPNAEGQNEEPISQTEARIPEGNYDFPPKWDYFSLCSDSLKEGVESRSTPQYFIIGFSRDEKLASVNYLPIAGSSINIMLQDLKSGEIEAESFELMGQDKQLAASEIWKQNQEGISTYLRKAAILPIESSLPIHPFPAQLNLADGTTSEYQVDYQIKRTVKTDRFAEDGVHEEKISLRKDGSSPQEVYTNTFNDSDGIEASELIGYFLHPYEDWMIICKLNREYGFKGDALYPYFIHVDLGAL